MAVAATAGIRQDEKTMYRNKHRYLLGILLLAVQSSAVLSAANPPSNSGDTLDAVVIDGHAPPRDEKSYANLRHAMQVFEDNRSLAPQGALRFRVLPWREEAETQGLTLTLRGKTLERPIPVAPDGSFRLDNDPKIEARLVSNRPPRSLAWRADIRTPGLPPHTRRLGDLRLECKVDLAGAGSDLATGIRTPALIALAAVSDPCMNHLAGYPWFADYPIFSVTLVSGSRRWVMPTGTDGTPYMGMYGWHLSPLFDF